MLEYKGVFENPRRGKQLLLFDDMRFLNSVTPTDVDALIDVKDKVLLLFEAKLMNKEVPLGQKLALERLVADAKKAGKHAAAIVCEHTVIDPDVGVFLRDTIVREVYTTETMAWTPPKWRITAKEAADSYIRRFFGTA